MGVVVVDATQANNYDPHPARLRFASAVDPPHKGEGSCGTNHALTAIERVGGIAKAYSAIRRRRGPRREKAPMMSLGLLLLDHQVHGQTNETESVGSIGALIARPQPGFGE